MKNKSNNYRAVIINRTLSQVNFGQTGTINIKGTGKHKKVFFIPDGSEERVKIDENGACIFNTDDTFDPEKLQIALNKL